MVRWTFRGRLLVVVAFLLGTWALLASWADPARADAASSPPQGSCADLAVPPPDADSAPQAGLSSECGAALSGTGTSTVVPSPAEVPGVEGTLPAQSPPPAPDSVAPLTPSSGEGTVAISDPAVVAPVPGAVPADGSATIAPVLDAAVGTTGVAVTTNGAATAGTTTAAVATAATGTATGGTTTATGVTAVATAVAETKVTAAAALATPAPVPGLPPKSVLCPESEPSLHATFAPAGSESDTAAAGSHSTAHDRAAPPAFVAPASPPAPPPPPAPHVPPPAPMPAPMPVPAGSSSASAAGSSGCSTGHTDSQDGVYVVHDRSAVSDPALAAVQAGSGFSGPVVGGADDPGVRPG